MKRVIYFSLLICAILIGSLQVVSQVLEAENTYTITGKSKRGALGNVDFDAGNGTYTLTYVTKANDKKARFEIYTFDKDFNFISMDEDEIEFEKAKTKYSWFKYQGELYTVKGLFVEPNLVGTLVLRQKEITYKYDWFLLGYYKDVDVLKKIKPKADEDTKYHYFAHTEDEETGEVLILCGLKDNIGKNADGYRHLKDMAVLKFNAEAELVGQTEFSFDYPMDVAFSRYIGNDAGGVGGMVFVFAPMGGPGMNKVADPNLNNYAYVRVNANPEVVDNIRFDSHAPYWAINEMVIDPSNDDVYLFGPSAKGKEKYFNVMRSTNKFEAVQLMKISRGDIAYFTETDLEEFESKLKTPPAQKKAPSYEGKKFQIANYKIASNGDFFVSGQNFKPGNDGPQFLDIMAFHFDNKGKLKAQYGVDTEESNKYAKSAGAEQLFIENSDGSKMYWFKQEIVGVSNARGKMLAYPSGTHISLADGNVGDFTSYGGDEGYYLDPTFPFLETDKGNTIVFFGSDKKGKEIWFARVKLD